MGPGAGMVADPAKANEQAAPSAPNVTSANTVFRIESLRCCVEAMIAVSRHDKKRRTVCRMRKPRDFGLSTLPPPGLALALQACKLDPIDQGIRGD